MTNDPTRSCKPNSSITATDSLPWQGRSLDISEDVVREYVSANSAYKAADSRWKQAQAALKHAHAEGLLQGHFDDLSETYEFSGVSFSNSERTTWPISGFSEELQALHKQEKDDGTAKPTISQYLRAKFAD